MKRLEWRLLAAFGIAGLLLPGTASRAEDPSGIVTLRPDQMTWTDFPGRPGVKLAVIEGGLKEPGPFTVRLKFPPNFKLNPHWHSVTEHLTVISGTLYLGAGDTLDESRATALPPGSAAVTPAKVHHYAFTKGDEVVIQTHGTGPWDSTPVAAAASAK
jgi:mannose-6-phosphate isomerase-like protein (cupin superfamily)